MSQAEKDGGEINRDSQRRPCYSLVLLFWRGENKTRWAAATRSSTSGRRWFSWQPKHRYVAASSLQPSRAVLIRVSRSVHRAAAASPRRWGNASRTRASLMLHVLTVDSRTFQSVEIHETFCHSVLFWIALDCSFYSAFSFSFFSPRQFKRWRR